MMNLERMADDLFDNVKAYVGRALVPLSDLVKGLGARLEAIEKREPPKDGKDGAQGPAGQDGKSVSAEELLPMIAAEVARQVAEQIKAIPIPENGKDGKDGPVGPNGMDGRDGVDGKDGSSVTVEDVLPLLKSLVADEVKTIPVPQNGKDGRDGRDGIDGAKGLDGADGRDGKPGEPGRHAVQIQILPSIDPSESYARGTFAFHKGGVIYASRSTDPVTDSLEKAGWDIAWNGIDTAEFIQQEHKRVALGLTTTKGQSISTPIPGFVYRGVYKEGDSYIEGDMATWAGSGWIAEKDTQAKPGTPDSGWRLAVKAGRDAAKPEFKAPSGAVKLP